MNRQGTDIKCIEKFRSGFMSNISISLFINLASICKNIFIGISGGD